MGTRLLSSWVVVRLGGRQFSGEVLQRVGETVCFFFQAEDGIRDLTVTGVQTCALPIFIFISSGVLFADALEFQASAAYAAGSSPWGVASGDFNRDGKPDIVAANSGANNVDRKSVV